MVIAYIIGFILSKVEHNREIEISLTAILAYGSFIIAQELFHVSGVTSTVAAGLILGTWGHTKISPEIITFNAKFWEFLAYFANALIFLVVGISVKITSLSTNSWNIFAVIIAISISRLIVIYGLMPLINKLPNQPNIDMRYQTIMYWGGLRGAIALAIILSIEKFQYSELFTTIILGVVLYTLIIQGLTIEKLVKFLSLDKLSISEQFSRIQANFIAKKKSISAINEMKQMGMLSANTANEIYTKCYNELDIASKDLTDFKKKKFSLSEEKIYLFKRCFSVQRTLFFEMFTKGHFANITYNRLVYRLEEQMIYIYKNINHSKLSPHFDINKGFFLKILINYINKLQILPKLSTYLNAKYIALNYKFAWGSYHGAKKALSHIKEIELSDHFSNSSISYVYYFFNQYHLQIEKYLLSISSEFPDFVTHMQTRLAERILLSTEVKYLDEQIVSGMIPEELAKDLKQSKYAEIIKKRETPEKIANLYTNNSFEIINIFKNLPDSELDFIKKISQEKLIKKDSVIISQDSRSEFIYFITSGVIDIIKNTQGHQIHIASLISGNYFSTNENETSEYEYKATTICKVIFFDNATLTKILNNCPNFKNNLTKSKNRRKNLFEFSKIETPN
ncbi:MAG: cation:proton antiporter [Legionellales bacterium]|nr:cation:proton antiporter [Legionellales bacterium]